MTTFKRLLTLIFLVALTPNSHGSLRCGTSLVSDDAWPLEVEEQCGPPDYIADYPTATVPGLGVVQTEIHWYYNHGPQRFIRRLIFRNGKLNRVESLGYGFYTSGRASCSPGVLRQATNEYELITRCGEPASRRVEWKSPAHWGHSNAWRAQQPVLVQEWLYDFSNNQFRQAVTLKNGQVVGIESRTNR